MAAKKKVKGRKAASPRACTIRTFDLRGSGIRIEDLKAKPFPSKKVRVFLLSEGIVVKSKAELLNLLKLACKAGIPPITTLNAPFKLGHAPAAV